MDIKTNRCLVKELIDMWRLFALGLLFILIVISIKSAAKFFIWLFNEDERVKNGLEDKYDLILKYLKPEYNRFAFWSKKKQFREMLVAIDADDYKIIPALYEVFLTIDKIAEKINRNYQNTNKTDMTIYKGVLFDFKKVYVSMIKKALENNYNHIQLKYIVNEFDIKLNNLSTDITKTLSLHNASEIKQEISVLDEIEDLYKKV